VIIIHHLLLPSDYLFLTLLLNQYSNLNITYYFLLYLLLVIIHYFANIQFNPSCIHFYSALIFLIYS